MKSIVNLFIVLFYTALQAQAQNFQPIVADSNISFYLDPTTSKIHAIKIDSNYLTKNDRIFELHKTWNNDGSCVKPNGPSWLGSKFIVDQNGRYLFFSSTGDTVFFYPNTNINTEWLFYTYNSIDSNYVMAKITKKSVLSFLNITDSIIEISFKEYSQDGKALPVASMQYPIQISKKHGFISMYNWNELEYNGMKTTNKPLTIFGMTKYNLGETFLTQRKLYDFSIGDEFHYEIANLGPGISPNYKANRIKKVISKYTSNNTDTIIYTYSRKEFIDYMNTNKPNYNDTLINDTIKETRMVREDKLYVPNEPIPYPTYNGGYWGNELQWRKNDTRLRYSVPQVFYYTSDSICWRQAHGDPGETRTYMIGCGLFERISGGGIFTESSERLVYVNKKDGTLWGIPVKVGLVNQGVKNAFDLFPNPIHKGETLQIKIDKRGAYSLKILNILGEVLFTANAEAFNDHINLDHLNAGIYFINITENNHIVYSQKLIKE